MCVLAIVKDRRAILAADSTGCGPSLDGAMTMFENSPDAKIFQPLPGVLVGGFSTIARIYFQTLQDMAWPERSDDDRPKWSKDSRNPSAMSF